MSRENVEAVKRAVDAMNRDDVEAVLREFDPAIEVHMALQELVGGVAGVYHGHDGVREYFRDMDDAFAEVEIDFPEIRDLGDRALAIGSFRTRGRHSGAVIESPVAALVYVDADSKATRVLTYLDPKDALEAAGLEEWAMSRENVELVRHGFETWRRTRELDFELLHPDVVWVLHGTPAGDVTYRGRDDVRGWFADQDEAWSDQWWEVEEIRETRDGRVLALIVAHGVGRGSDVPVTLPLANIWTIDEGRVTHFEMFIDRRAALEAAGLRE